MCILKLCIPDVYSQSWGVYGGNLNQVKVFRCAFSKLEYLVVSWSQVKVSVCCLFSKLARRITDILGNDHVGFLIEPSESEFFFLRWEQKIEKELHNKHFW